MALIFLMWMWTGSVHLQVGPKHDSAFARCVQACAKACYVLLMTVIPLSFEQKVKVILSGKVR